MRFCTIAMASVAFFGIGAQAEAAGSAGPWVGAEAAWEDYGSAPEDGDSYALNAGWDFEINDSWITGVVLRAVVDGVDTTETTTTPTSIATARVQLEDQWNLSVRFGYRASPAVLIFGEAGFERLHVKSVRTVRAPVCAPPNGCVISRLDASFDEELWTAGVGVEWSMSDRLRLRAGYSFGEGDAFDRQRVALGLNYAF